MLYGLLINLHIAVQLITHSSASAVRLKPTCTPPSDAPPTSISYLHPVPCDTALTLCAFLTLSVIGAHDLPFRPRLAEHSPCTVQLQRPSPSRCVFPEYFRKLCRRLVSTIISYPRASSLCPIITVCPLTISSTSVSIRISPLLTPCDSNAPISKPTCCRSTLCDSTCLTLRFHSSNSHDRKPCTLRSLSY